MMGRLGVGVYGYRPRDRRDGCGEWIVAGLIDPLPASACSASPAFRTAICFPLRYLFRYLVWDSGILTGEGGPSSAQRVDTNDHLFTPMLCHQHLLAQQGKGRPL